LVSDGEGWGRQVETIYNQAGGRQGRVLIVLPADVVNASSEHGPGASRWFTKNIEGALRGRKKGMDSGKADVFPGKMTITIQGGGKSLATPRVHHRRHRRPPPPPPPHFPRHLGGRPSFHAACTNRGARK